MIPVLAVVDPTRRPEERSGPMRKLAASRIPSRQRGDLVELVDAAHRPIGFAPDTTAHHRDTPLHKGFSCYLFHARTGLLLLTRRSTTRRTWPGVWTNTCGGHPLPGEPLADAVTRRVRAELGLVPASLRLALPDFAYRATDPGGIVEHEVCPVLIGAVCEDPCPNPADVAGWEWAHWGDIGVVAARTPWLLTPWAAEQIPRLTELFARVVQAG
jgi:isopentenyl-diphosphate Delta-isomerase